MATKIVISTTNDIATDQRMQKFCRTLHSAGFEISWIGRWKKNSLPVSDKNFISKRFVLLFNKGPLFYLSYNWRLFWFLLFSKADIFFAVDLDTAPAQFLASKIRRKPLVIDNHEYFTGVPELNERKTVQSIWKTAEKFIYKRTPHQITVNDSLKILFEQEYPAKFEVVRNFPLKPLVLPETKSFPEKEIRIIYQGVLNKDRGLEETIEAFSLLPGNYRLIIAGDGDISNSLYQMVVNYSLQDKIKFAGRLSPGKLSQLTKLADAGISFEKDTNINYRFSLPNKIFDYMNAGIPVLVTDLPEMKKIVEEYKTGLVLKEPSPQKIAEIIQKMFSDKNQYLNFCTNAVKASETLNWESQEKNIVEFFNHVSAVK